MQVRVKVIQVLPAESGVSRSSGNPWSKQVFIGETYDQYPQKIAFVVFGDKCSIPPVDSDAEVDFDISSRPWAGKDGVERWSTDIKAYAVKVASSVGAVAVPKPEVPSAAAYQAPPQPQSDPNDLPF